MAVYMMDFRVLKLMSGRNLAAVAGLLLSFLLVIGTAAAQSTRTSSDGVVRIITVAQFAPAPGAPATTPAQQRPATPPAQPGQPAPPQQGDPNRAIGTGTGFIVSGRRLVITNNHVVNLTRVQGNQRVRPQQAGYGIAVLRAGQPVIITARLRAVLPEKDLALLEAEEDLPGSAVTVADYESERDIDVEAVGFPGIADIAVDLSTNRMGNIDRAQLEPFKTQGRIQRTFDVSGLVIDGNALTARVVLHTASISGGNSGGPLFNRCRQVVGVNTFTPAAATVGTTFNHSVASQEVVRFLRAQNVSPTIASRFCALPGSFSDYLNLQTALAFAAVLLGLAALVIAKQRPQVIQQTVSRVQNTFSRVNRNQPGSGGSGSGPGAAAPRTPDPAPQQPRPVAATAAAPAAGPRRAINPAGPVVRLVPTSGGAALEIAMNRLTGGQAIIVGRSLELMQEKDPHDHPIVINDKTVSRRHARLTLDDRNRLVVEDLESSAGTFKGSQKITTASFVHGEEVKFGSAAYRIALPASG
ncbi:MAG: trypsin-like peptidase domain-containing protein [Hyphomicrobiaceae bacterium]